MAGMLPGVECARRRRLHVSGSGGGGGSFEQPSGSRRSSFCLYTTGHDSHHTTTFMKTRRHDNKEVQEAMLDVAAREAKERLDARLLGIKSVNTMKSKESTNNMVMKEVYSHRRKLRWSKFGWKALEQSECVICLEEFKGGDLLAHLPCAHRFHWSCAMPWIESASLCPCCRITVGSAP